MFIKINDLFVRVNHIKSFEIIEDEKVEKEIRLRITFFNGKENPIAYHLALISLEMPISYIENELLQTIDEIEMRETHCLYFYMDDIINTAMEKWKGEEELKKERVVGKVGKLNLNEDI